MRDIELLCSGLHHSIHPINHMRDIERQKS